MYGNSVSFRDYEGVAGFGIGSMAEVDELNKALTAGTQRPPATGGSALRVESLEATLRTVTFSLGHVKLWPKIPKIPAYSTVEEYNLLQGYGANSGAFTNDGDLPETQDSNYARRTALVKFLGTTREVSHPMTLVRPAHGNVIALETQNGTVWLVERLERALFTARADVVTQEFDGLERQILDGNGVIDPWTNYPVAAVNPGILDCRGGLITEDLVEQAANLVVQNYGTPTGLHLAPRALSDLAKQFYPRERVNLPAPADGKVGFAITSFNSSAGLIQFNPNIFLRAGDNGGVKTPPAAATSPRAPNPPLGVVNVAAGNANSHFIAADAGNYFYQVTALNRFGESASTASLVVAVVAADGVTVTITDGGGANPATGYRIYRTNAGGAVGTAQVMVLGVPRDTVTPIDTVFVDNNYYLPGTSKAFLLQENLQYFSFRQLAPMMKMTLATIAPSIRWMQLLYGVPIVYAPRKSLMFINVLDD